MNAKLSALFIPLALCAAAASAPGCSSVSGDLDGLEFGRISTALYGEVETDYADALTIQLIDRAFSCEDLVQRWTPDEADAFPAFNSLSLTTRDADEGEYDIEADDSDERFVGGVLVYDDGLDLDEVWVVTEGTVTVDNWNEGRSLSGEFELTLEDDDGEEGELTGKFSATFCRNLSDFDD